MTQTPWFTTLSGRGLIHIEGPERVDFLQNLVSNDVSVLDPGKAVYACLLTPQGKFLFDFFICAGDDFILLECEGGTRAQDLYRRLNMYRLRADVKISIEDAVPVYAVFGTDSPPGYPDPRHKAMGYRSFEKPDGMEEKPFDAWDIQRIKLCIPDGSRDLIPEHSTLDEGNVDRLNGVSYEKGCYVGQELTARMHHRGLGKKHLYALHGNALPAPGEDIVVEAKTLGQMRSKCGESGLALLKDEYIQALDQVGISLLT